MSCTTLVRLGSSEKRVPAYVSGCIYQSVGGLHNNYLKQLQTPQSSHLITWSGGGEEREEGGEDGAKQTQKGQRAEAKVESLPAFVWH